MAKLEFGWRTEMFSLASAFPSFRFSTNVLASTSHSPALLVRMAASSGSVSSTQFVKDAIRRLRAAGL